MRLACVYAPQIALQAVLRRDPERREGEPQPVVLADGSVADRARVVGLTRTAAQAGIRIGHTVSQARALWGDGHAEAAMLDGTGGRSGGGPIRRSLRVLATAPADTAAAEAALADVGYAFAPRVEAEPGRIFLEVGDLRRMFPSERAVAQGLAALAARVGLAVRVGIASSKAVARVASEAADVALVPHGEADARAFLAPLPVRHALGAPALATHAEMLAGTLARWGIHTLGALAALPRAEVAVRLGEPGAELARTAAAALDEPFAPRLPADALEEGTELDWAIADLEPLAFVLRGLFDRALARLAGRGLGCAGVTVRFKLEPRGHEVREVPLAAPARETAPLLQLVRLELARRPPSAPVTGVALLLRPARVRAMQLDFLRPAGPAPERLAATLARLAALVGLDNVGAPALVESHREEAVAINAFRGALVDSPAPAPRPDVLPTLPTVPTLAFRRFRPPHALEVLMGRDGPTALRGADTTARVLVAAGPYRASGEWWSGDGFSRDYWDLQASDGAVYRVHQDRRDGRWYLDGYYD